MTADSKPDQTHREDLRNALERKDSHMTVTRTVPPTPLVRALERIRHHVYQFHQHLVPAPAAMSELITGEWVSQAIAAAAQLDVADALAAGPLSLDELAGRVGADDQALARLLRALISRGIFRQLQDGRYALTRLADTLRTDAPVSVRGMARLIGSRQHREFWSLLADAVRTGRPVIPMLHGTDAFGYLSESPELAGLFNDAMTALSEVFAASVTDAYDFTAFNVVVDVGGGHGRLMSAILSACPGVRGVLYDLPDVVAGAPPVLDGVGVSDRVRVEGGSFFTDPLPADGDIYILKNVIHDWNDHTSQAILSNIGAAAPATATLLLVEQVIPDHNREFTGKWSDLEMMVMGEGRERTADEYRDLLHNSGFSVNRIIETTSSVSLIEAAPTRRCARYAPVEGVNVFGSAKPG
jgi:C-methyltransferase